MDEPLGSALSDYASPLAPLPQPALDHPPPHLGQRRGPPGLARVHPHQVEPVARAHGTDPGPERRRAGW